VYIPLLFSHNIQTEHNTHFLKIPKNILSLLVSSGGFSAVCAAAAPASVPVSLAVDEGAVLAGESSAEVVDSMTIYAFLYKIDRAIGLEL